LPKIIVVTNIDKEHLDYFKTFANVKKAFKNFIKKLPKDGFLVDKISQPAGRQAAKDIKKIKPILKVPGMHNVYNAVLALQVARILAIPDEITLKALSEFSGTWRRFEVKEGIIGNPPSRKASARQRKITVVSDYAHHPNEILATLKAAREKYGNPPSHKASARRRKIWCVFQPHQHQRTYYLFNDFVKVFKKAKIDNIIITDIYDVAGRETKKINEEVSSEKLVKKIKQDLPAGRQENVSYLPTDKVENHIKENIKAGDVLIIMGAGDIYKLADKF
jgi:UDP-N-acetylmuramate--alanine ligase